ncbi:MAG TPA: DUF2231 domain-containing protein [Steroidobacteraceae bacterium]|nr:DUF2231 domain-containing protein [Steroidobacteraceae bacterium]
MKGSSLLHPLHPALAHFPVAFWVGSSASDLIELATGNAAWWTVSRCAVAAGVIVGTVTLLAGALELWLRKLPTEAWRWAGLHAALTSTALLCFMVSLSWRAAGPPPLAAVWVSALGSAMVIGGGFCGGTLVYGYGVGVSWRAGRPE